MVWLMYLTFNLCPVMHVWPLHESLSLWRGLCNSMKLWDMLCRATQDQWVMVESSDKMLPIGGRNGKPLLYSCCGNPMNSIKREKDITPEGEPSRSEGGRCATGEERRASAKSCRKNERAGQSGNNTHLWMFLVMKVKSNAIKKCIA